MFSRRESSPEIMDDTSITDCRLYSALDELKLINRFLGGETVTKAGLQKFNSNSGSDFTLLDTGSGGAVISNHQGSIKVISLDKNLGACRYIRKYKSDSIPVCADVKALPFQIKSVDIIHTSLFLHHFNEAELLKILQSFLEVSRHGIIINDLRRSFPAYLGIRFLTAVFSRSEMVKHDGPLSVRKGFKYTELKEMLSRLGIGDYILKRKWAFRWLLVIKIK
jgi:ubiquinone/menaquinone biosynthesis C-methylase UbiE